MITLQLTQSCNFRCSYCIYSDFHNEKQRQHSAKHMTIETAKEAVDFMAKHSKNVDMVSVGFYGGEPLLAFDLIQKIVPYAEDLFEGRELMFTMTTNGSLLTDKVIDYLHDHEVHVMISLDGPEQIHNINRRYASTGKGSFEDIVNRLVRVKEKYPDWFEKIHVSMVVDPQNDYDQINELFEEGSIFQELTVTSSIVDDTYSVRKTIVSDEYLEKDRYHDFLAYVNEIQKDKSEHIARKAQQKLTDLVTFKKALKLSTQLSDTAAPSGPCIPGRDRLFINVDGDLFPCERVSELTGAMKIGTLSRGFEAAKVKKLLNIACLTEDKCKDCWAFLHCVLCARYADNNGKLSGEVKSSFCQNVCDKREEDLLKLIMLQECGAAYRKVKNGHEW